MSMLTANPPRTSERQAGEYARMCLPELSRRIAYADDRLALEELHDRRTVFRLHDGPAMLLVQFVETLCQTPWASSLANGSDRALERAYDLTIDKFGHMPRAENAAAGRRTNGADCRHYFRAFHSLVAEWSSAHPNTGGLLQEMHAAQMLQRLVCRHFKLSCLEANRSLNPGRSRYAWRTPKGVLYVWMPAYMPGHRCRVWLKENVNHVDASRPGEQSRAQVIVDRRLGLARRVPLENDVPNPEAAVHSGCGPATPLIEDQITVHGLAKVVADEKADQLHRQRPAIRALGPEALRRLILRVFADLSEDQYEEKRLAQAFGLTPSTFSRFAGSRWRLRPDARPPDLWLNVAMTLAKHPPFIEAAQEAGVWTRVEQVLTADPPSEEGGPHHG